VGVISAETSLGDAYIADLAAYVCDSKRRRTRCTS